MKRCAQFQDNFKANHSKTTSSKMTDLTMIKISKGVWISREPVTTWPVMNPEADSVYYPKTSVLARQNAEAGGSDLVEARPLEPVAAMTYAQAREYAEAAEKARIEYRGLPPAPAMSDVGKPVTDWKKKTD